MLIEILEREDARRRIVLLVGEVASLLGGLVFQTQAAVEDGEVVMRGKVIGINARERFVLCACKFIPLLLIVVEAEFAISVLASLAPNLYLSWHCCPVEEMRSLDHSCHCHSARL
jgi:hypothetical protein